MSFGIAILGHVELGPEREAHGVEGVHPLFGLRGGDPVALDGGEDGVEGLHPAGEQVVLHQLLVGPLAVGVVEVRGREEATQRGVVAVGAQRLA